MKVILVRDGLTVALVGLENLPTSMKAEDKKELQDKTYNALILGLNDKVLWEVKKEKSVAQIWGNFNSFYMSKNAPNRLLLK